MKYYTLIFIFLLFFFVHADDINDLNDPDGSVTDFNFEDFENLSDEEMVSIIDKYFASKNEDDFDPTDQQLLEMMRNYLNIDEDKGMEEFETIQEEFEKYLHDFDEDFDNNNNMDDENFNEPFESIEAFDDDHHEL